MNQNPSPQVETKTPEILAHAQQIISGLSAATCDEAKLIIDLVGSLLAVRRWVEREARVALVLQQQSTLNSLALDERDAPEYPTS
jgi:hypothetical protein